MATTLNHEIPYVGIAQRGGMLVVNADDWGRDQETTDATLACLRRGTVSAVSAMVFMEDSERAAAMALEGGIDAGLHLNLTTAFSGRNVPSKLAEQQQRISAHLRRHRLAPIVFHPGLMRCFEYVVESQLEEFRRLYGSAPDRIDGHHHMHLCTNVLFAGLLPAGTTVRRNFSFRRGEKSAANRLYRKGIDSLLAMRHPTLDFLFCLPPVEPRSRLQAILELAETHTVELETHPVIPEEFRFLMSEDAFASLGSPRIASFRSWREALRVN